jgi:NAD(P)-dependent dehydrogenase (short-subunit alcohol dehydrogenase family)
MSQTVVVTGASAGVGRATVREFAKRGASVGLIARGAAGLEAARAEAEDLGAAKAVVASADVSDPDQLASAAARIEAELGPFDVWVNDAMVSVFAPSWEIAPSEFRRVMEVDYLGFVHGTLEALARMRPRNSGTIVQVGSALAYRGIPGQAPYCASKHAIQGFMDSLRSELFAEDSGVRVTMVQLPALNTPQFGWVRTRLSRHPQPVPPIFQPEVAARGIVWAAEHAPRELNVGASTVLTRLGNALAPGLLDRYLGRTGISSQQTDQRVNLATWDDNVDQPDDATRDHGAHGEFDDKAHGRSWQLTARMHRGELAAAAAGTAAALAALLVRRRH